eukprot:CAMPEP_0114625028 /NCGR_PEP_ID=MMETSP0168-20121206/11064_1 /TAXON_ID=95228 ORGANISM="Vannella sp., Strain DIVA3 517/6/12" /NCGR_SAMPLE_ID=MMETSP0168 /ASSEMBLY_ACC=CAM_ASM_000044 /LENGTH=240 /DNA_ID=CAMNT_0001836307 /DNA_START=22 /DNA_END=744 /DNA_ORIENTATION=+
MAGSGSGYQLGTYLETYLESIGTLPTEIKRNFTLIKELDQRTKETHKAIEDASTECLRRTSNSSLAKRKEARDQVRQLYAKCQEYADEKVSLAMQTYELVDKHIRRLDLDLRKFEHELESQGHRPSPGRPPKRKLGAHQDSPASKKRLSASTERKKSSLASPIARPIPSLSVSLDMPIDPNEPVYCFCKRVSFGEMVGCDNPECRVEWFHFECVGLTQSPKGRWLCPECVKTASNIKKKK